MKVQDVGIGVGIGITLYSFTPKFFDFGGKGCQESYLV